MPIITDTLPQQIKPIKITLLSDVIKSLPEKLDYNINVWIGDKLARYGQTDGNLMFLIEQEDEPSREQRMYFGSIAKPFSSTVSANWKDQKLSAIRLYNNGKLIIDKDTLTYKELPLPTSVPIIKVEDVVSKLPKSVDCKETIYLVGGLVKNGWSGNDVDFMVDSEDIEIYRQLRNFFGKILGCKVDVGNAPMPEREPIYKVKIYEGGKWQL